jgi:hypothetical protein
MTREEALKILGMYRDWNEGQKSVSFAFRGVRTDEDDVYDARRALLKEATELLRTKEAKP